MAAVRRRISPVGQPSAPPRSPDSAAPPRGSPAAASSDGWQTPKKVARRHANRGALVLSPIGTVSSPVSDSPVPVFHGSAPGGRSNAPVPVVVEAAGLKPRSSSLGSSRKAKQSGAASGLSPHVSVYDSQACRLAAAVPFLEIKGDMLSESNQLVPVPVSSSALIHLGPVKLSEMSASPKSIGVGLSGPSKRARPVEPVSNRIVSKASKGKGKALLRGKPYDASSFTFSALPESQGGTEGSTGPRLLKSRRKDLQVPGPGLGPFQSDQTVCLSHEEAVAKLKTAIQGKGSVEQMDSSQDDVGGDQGLEGPLVANNPIVEQMPGDREGVPISPKST